MEDKQIEEKEQIVRNLIDRFSSVRLMLEQIEDNQRKLLIERDEDKLLMLAYDSAKLCQDALGVLKYPVSDNLTLLLSIAINKKDN